jgi:hypothetical protein
MNYPLFYKLALIPNNYFAFFILIIVGLYFINQKNFFYITIGTLFSIILTAFLKSIWQIPLNPELKKLGWSYPSTHTVFNTVFFATLLIFYRKLWLFLLSLFILTSGFFAMIHFRYHIWIDIFGGICTAGILITLVYYWIRYAIHAQLQFGILLTALSCLLLFCLPEQIMIYTWDWQVLGLIIGLTIGNNYIKLGKFNYKIKSISICLLLPLVAVAKKLIAGDSLVINFLAGIIISFSVFFIIPCVNYLYKRALAVFKQ